MAQTAKLMRECAFQCGFTVIKLHVSHHSDVSFAAVTHPGPDSQTILGQTYDICYDNIL